MLLVQKKMTLSDHIEAFNQHIIATEVGLVEAPSNRVPQVLGGDSDEGSCEQQFQALATKLQGILKKSREQIVTAMDKQRDLPEKLKLEEEVSHSSSKVLVNSSYKILVNNGG